MNTNLFLGKKEREWLKGVLKDGVVTIEFVKQDGTERKMNCTLNENKIPEKFTPKSENRKKSDEALAVFDVEKQEWRSFRFDSITRINFSI